MSIISSTYTGRLHHFKPELISAFKNFYESHHLCTDASNFLSTDISYFHFVVPGGKFGETILTYECDCNKTLDEAYDLFFTTLEELVETNDFSTFEIMPRISKYGSYK